MYPEVSLPTPYQQFIHQSRYAKWKEDEGRREKWGETVARYVEYFKSKFPQDYPAQELYKAISNLEVMPSMRALMTAGPALERDPIAGFNCSFVAIDDVRAFDEVLYVLMCGTGVGFSVERQHIVNLPNVPKLLTPIDHTIHVRDSKGGWAGAFRELIANLYSGYIPQWDVSQVRAAGERLKTFGGRASGPQPLVDLFEFTVKLFKRAKGRKLESIECHDLVCKIADIVVVGGVRRSALISISNLSDDRMRNAKNGNWWEGFGHRALANNSASYTDRPGMEVWMKEMMALYESRCGERGVFNLHAAHRKATESGRRLVELIAGTNPCAEILLRSCGLCNLSEVIIRAGDSLATLKQKVKLATIIGTFQSTLLNFRYVRDIWRQNQEEERLLGVSLTGIMDHEVLSQTNEDCVRWLQELKATAIETNRKWAAKLGINPAAAITCVKPSGTVSQLTDSASGIHARHAPYYLRTVRADKKDPLAQLMRAQGFFVEDAFGKEDSTDVFYFPQKTNPNAVFRNDRTAIEQLEHYLLFQKHWSEHNVSNTIYYHEDEFLEVAAWMYKHFDELAGVSLLPHTDHVYKQAPYIDCDKTTYLKHLNKLPNMDWTHLKQYETSDNSVNTKELACSAGGCEIF